jgi:Asp-tRNA(Asn)/Glu-tRNA(Gln) amidotransferase A subunit family amidase
LISRSGVIPIAHSQDTAGPMARCVTDAAILLGAMAGFDSHDAATLYLKDQAPSDYTFTSSRRILMPTWRDSVPRRLFIRWRR